MNTSRALFLGMAFLSAQTVLCAEPRDATALLEAIRERHQLPSLSAAMVRRGELVAIGACGVRKWGDPAPVTQEDRWHIGSCTKSMTASLAAMLVAEGKLSWQTTVAEVFPEWRAGIQESWRAVTLEQLLSHRAGAPHDPPPDLWEQAWKQSGTPTAQRREFVRGLLAQSPELPPGTQFLYSNQGYSIAGAMMEKVTGKAWEALLRERLFVPLDMKSAGFGAPATPGKVDQPWGHRDGAAKIPVPPGPGADNPPAIGPGGTVHCSIGDLARYAGWHARGSQGGATLLDDAGFSKIHRAAEGQDYAMGWFVAKRDWADGFALSHNGSNTMFYAVMWLAPQKEAAFVVATNVAGTEAQKACDEAVGALIRAYLTQ